MSHEHSKCWQFSFFFIWHQNPTARPGISRSTPLHRHPIHRRPITTTTHGLVGHFRNSTTTLTTNVKRSLRTYGKQLRFSTHCTFVNHYIQTQQQLHQCTEIDHMETSFSKSCLKKQLDTFTIKQKFSFTPFRNTGGGGVIFTHYYSKRPLKTALPKTMQHMHTSPYWSSDIHST